MREPLKSCPNQYRSHSLSGECYLVPLVLIVGISFVNIIQLLVQFLNFIHSAASIAKYSGTCPAPANMRLSVKHKRLPLRQLISKLTNKSRDHLTPELEMRLITPDSPLWKCRPEECPFVDPYWAFYWPGGQALTRFILDNSNIFQRKNILDVGCGCGASSIAAAIVGAKLVLANDIDTTACEATALNARLNRTNTLHILNDNILNKKSTSLGHVDIVLIGDMFYDSEFSQMLLDWLRTIKKSRVFVGDPGRHGLDNLTRSQEIQLVSEYDLLDHTVLENNGFKTSRVWEVF
ncbi:methyltransferase like 20 [Nesidiocoris tenuis]|uniref:ETFB lysine methyltransferase n=1 Tax=Nesidiocoris tenuis TaxID=355587 RepID=A0ABN7ACY2_9HEMI|nr:methyltransferase like 20 [Nesidiocoris tenuis]